MTPVAKLGRGPTRAISRPLPAFSRRFDKAVPSESAAPGRLERIFFYISMIVMQGAFLTTLRLIMSGGAESDDFVSGDPITQVSFGFVIGGTLVLSLVHSRTSLQAFKSNLFYFILPCVIICSTAWSVAPALTLKRSIWTTSICFFDLYIITRLSLDEIFAIISKTMVVSIIASIAVAVAMPNVGRELGPGLDGEWRGVFAQKNLLGHVMATGAVVQLLIMLRANRFKVGATLLLLACLVMVKLSGSATSLVATAAAICVAISYICIRRGLASALVGALVAGAAISVLVAVIFHQDASGLALLGRDDTLSGRTDLWPPVIEMIRSHLWTGWGFEAFWTPQNPNYEYVRTLAGWPAPNAHNGLLEVGLDGGLLGIGTVLLVLGWAIRRAIRLLASGEFLGIAIIIVIVQLLIGNITESFMIESTIFGWNFMTMLIMSSGLGLLWKPAAERPLDSLLDRAKPKSQSDDALEDYQRPS